MRKQIEKKRRNWTGLRLPFLSLLCLLTAACTARELDFTVDPIPTILLTDIGSDIDDTWALGFLLKCPELDLKLVVTDLGRVEYRTKLVAKFLQQTGHGDIPVGKGVPFDHPRDKVNQAKWVEDYDLASYPGTIHEDGVQALIDLVMASEETIHIVAIGPTPDLEEALKREPRIAEKARVFGMYGSIRVGYRGATKAAKESNVVRAPRALQKVFAADWPITITPLDTCGSVRISGEKYKRIMASDDPVALAIMENYRRPRENRNPRIPNISDFRSTVMFDAVAVYLAFAQTYAEAGQSEQGDPTGRWEYDRFYPYGLCNMETLPIVITDDGYSRVEPEGRPTEVAISWADPSGFEDLMVERLAPLKP